MSNSVSDTSGASAAVSTGGAAEALKAKVAALRAEREALETQDENEELEASLAREGRLLQEAQARKEAKRQLGNKFAELRTPSGLVIVKRSGVGAYRKLQELEEIDLEKMEEFVSPCIFYPAPEAYEKLVAELPGVIPGIFHAVSVLMGAQRAETSKK